MAMEQFVVVMEETRCAVFAKALQLSMMCVYAHVCVDVGLCVNICIVLVYSNICMIQFFRH
jgi:hypothetical protein